MITGNIQAATDCTTDVSILGVTAINQVYVLDNNQYYQRLQETTCSTNHVGMIKLSYEEFKKFIENQGINTSNLLREIPWIHWVVFHDHQVFQQPLAGYEMRYATKKSLQSQIDAQQAAINGFVNQLALTQRQTRDMARMQMLNTFMNVHEAELYSLMLLEHQEIGDKLSPIETRFLDVFTRMLVKTRKHYKNAHITSRDPARAHATPRHP